MGVIINHSSPLQTPTTSWLLSTEGSIHLAGRAGRTSAKKARTNKPSPVSDGELLHIKKLNPCKYVTSFHSVGIYFHPSRKSSRVSKQYHPQRRRKLLITLTSRDGHHQSLAGDVRKSTSGLCTTRDIYLSSLWNYCIRC